MKAVVAAFNQEKALVGAFSVITILRMELFQALFQEAPFSHSLYHIVTVPTDSATVFAPLTDIVQSLAAEKRQLWERLWMMSDRRSGPVHPLIYR